MNTTAPADADTTDIIRRITTKLPMIPSGALTSSLQALARHTDADGQPTILNELDTARQLGGGRLHLFNGQMAFLAPDVFADTIKPLGYGGVEICTWGPGGLDIWQAAGPEGEAYCASFLEIFESRGLTISAVSDHINGQGLGDSAQVGWAGDNRLRGIVDKRLWPAEDDPNPSTTLRNNVIEHLKRVGLAASRLLKKKKEAGKKIVVNGFIGSQVWHALFDFPPRSGDEVSYAYHEMAAWLLPVLEEYYKLGVVFALEVHPGELIYSTKTAKDWEAALNAVCEAYGRPELADVFGYNLDPSHFPGQGLDAAEFALTFPRKIYNVHFKDTAVNAGPTRSTYCDHLPNGDILRHWIFMSGGRGDVRWYYFVVVLIGIGFDGEVAVEWEQRDMHFLYGIWEAAQFFLKVAFYPISERAFDDAFKKDTGSGEKPKSRIEVLLDGVRSLRAATS